MYEELRKGLKSSHDFIAFAPHLTQIVDWCLSGIHVPEAQDIPRPVLNPEPIRIVEPEINFNPDEVTYIDLSDFINENVRFADSEHSGVNPPPPTGVANPTDIEGSSRGVNGEEAQQKEREDRHRRESELTKELERKLEEERA